MRKTLTLLPLLATLALAGCSTSPTPAVTDANISVQQGLITDLTATVSALGAEVAAEEAARLARVSYEYTAQLKREYQITDPPLVHNTKVNMGIKPRGLCKDWADDLEARLKLENFQSLQLHRAIANSENPFRIEHSTVIVSRRGDSMYQGVVLDPWRNGGELFWAPFQEDTHYQWLPRQEVFARKRARAAR